MVLPLTRLNGQRSSIGAWPDSPPLRVYELCLQNIAIRRRATRHTSQPAHILPQCAITLDIPAIYIKDPVYVFSGFPLAASLCLASAYILLSTLGGNVGSGNVPLITSK